MARPKPKFVKIGCSILDDCATRETKLDMVMLAAFMQRRRFQDGLTLEEASSVVMNQESSKLVFGKAHTKSIRSSVELLAKYVSISWKLVPDSSDFLSIQWCSFADYQGKLSPIDPSRGPNPPPDWSQRRVEKRESREERTHVVPADAATDTDSTDRSPPNPVVKKPRKRKPLPPDWATAASLFLMRHLTHVDGARIPQGAELRWAREIERMPAEIPELGRLDCTSALRSRLEFAIAWVTGENGMASTDPEVRRYTPVVRCGKSLREKWPGIVAAMSRPPPSPKYETEDQRNLRTLREEGII